MLQIQFTSGSPQMSAIMLAVSAARFKSDEYIAANLGSLDSRPATLQINRDLQNQKHKEQNFIQR